MDPRTRRYVTVAIAGLLSVGWVPELFAQNWFELDVPLYVNSVDSGTIRIRIDLTGEFGPALATDALLALLPTIADIGELSVTEELCPACSWTPIWRVQNLGIHTRFDEQLVFVAIDVPASLRPVRRLTVNPEYRPDLSNALPVARHSGYVNFATGTELIADQDTVRVPYSVNVNGVANIVGWVVSGGISYFYDGYPRSHSVEPAAISLTKDFPANQMRLALGDLAYPVTGYQAYVPLQGIGISHLPDMRASERESVYRRFTIEHDSAVTIGVNGQTQKRFDLSAGRYDIASLGLPEGVNAVSVDVSNDDETYRFLFRAPFSGRLLGIGETAYAASIGVPQYTLEAPIITLFKRAGITNRLTSGVQAQLSPLAQVIGVETVWATPLGLFAASGAFSNTAMFGPDVALDLSYQLRSNARESSPTLFLSGSYTGYRFASVADPDPENETLLSLRGAIGVAVPHLANLNVGIRQQISRAPEGDTTSFTLGAVTSLAKYSTMRVRGAISLPETGTPEWEFSLSMSSQTQDRRATVSYAQDSSAVAPSVHASVRPDLPGGVLSLSAAMEGWPGGSDSERRASASGTYDSNRFTVGLSESVLGTDYSQTSVRASTAVAFADGHVAMSKPIADSFAIFPVSAELGSVFVGVNPVAGGYQTERDHVGSPVLAGLPSYHATPVTIDIPELPVGDELSTWQAVIYPTYRSGTVIPVEIVRSVFVTGKIVDGDGNPVVLRFGNASPVTGSGGVATASSAASPTGSISFFTDETGSFELYSIRPGVRYRLEIPGTEYPPYELEIPEDASGEVHVGSIRLDSHEEAQ